MEGPIARLTTLVTLALLSAANAQECVSTYAPVDTTGMWREHRAKVASFIANEFTEVSPDAQVVVIFGSNRTIERYSDLEWGPFRHNSVYRFVSSWDEPGSAIVFALSPAADFADGVLLVPEVTERDRIYDGLSSLEEARKRNTDVLSNVLPLSFLEELVDALLPTTSEGVVHTYDAALFEAHAPQIAARHRVEESYVVSAVETLRTYKDDTEIALLRVASQVTAEAETELMRRVRPGWTDQQVESQYRSLVTSCFGMRQYKTPTVSSGPNNRVLHSSTWERTVQPNELILIDCGPQYLGYFSDVTRSFPVSGVFDARQRALYQTVLNAQTAMLNTLRDGVVYGDVRYAQDIVLLEGLRAANFVNGTIDDLYNAQVLQYLLPHGPSHGVGLNVHDYPGAMGNDYVLRSRMVISIEPGIYFYDFKVAEARADPVAAPFMNFPLIESYLPLGGARVEDVVLITDDGHENLSGVAPKTIADIEAVMAGGRTSRHTA